MDTDIDAQSFIPPSACCRLWGKVGADTAAAAGGVDLAACSIAEEVGSLLERINTCFDLYQALLDLTKSQQQRTQVPACCTQTLGPSDSSQPCPRQIRVMLAMVHRALRALHYSPISLSIL